MVFNPIKNIVDQVPMPRDPEAQWDIDMEAIKEDIMMQQEEYLALTGDDLSLVDQAYGTKLSYMTGQISPIDTVRSDRSIILDNNILDNTNKITLLSKTSLDDAAAEPLVEPRHLVSAREKKATVPAQPKLFDLETEHPPEPKRKVALKEKGAAGDLRPSDGVSGSNVGQGQRTVTTGKETGKSGPTETNIKDSFAEFWKRYDLVTGKKDAEKAWAKIMKAAKADWKQVAIQIQVFHKLQSIWCN
jgi:hypothetical protein